MATQAERRESTRSAVIDAAIDAFVEAGGVEVGLDEIAQRAGVAKSTVLYHFGSRSAVLRSVAVRLFAAQEVHLGAFGDPADWVDRLLRLQISSEARLLHRVGDELAAAGELGAADPVEYLARRLDDVGVGGDARVLAAAIVQLSRQVAYGQMSESEIPGLVMALTAGVRLG